MKNTLTAVFGAVAGALTIDKFFNDGELTEQVVGNVGGITKEVIQKIEGGQIIKETINNTKEIVSNLGENIKENVQGVQENIKDVVPGIPNFSLPSLDLKTPSMSSEFKLNGGLAGSTSDFLGLGVFFSGANNIKNYALSSWTGQDVSIWNNKYGAQTNLVGPVRENPLTRIGKAGAIATNTFFDNRKNEVQLATNAVSNTFKGSSSKTKATLTRTVNSKNNSKYVGDNRVATTKITSKTGSVLGSYSNTAKQSLTASATKLADNKVSKLFNK